MSKLKDLNFFESVAHHNLERFQTDLESIFKSEIKTLVNSLSQHNFKDLLNDKLKNNN